VTVPSRMIPEACRVLEAVQETAKEVHFVLEAPKREAFVPEPGQFVMVSLPGIGEAPISLAALPGEGTPEGSFELLIRKAGRLTNLVTRLKPGGTLFVRGPYGRRVAWDAFRGSNLVLIAGGLGFAPLRPFVRRALARREEFRRIDIAVGARSPEELLFKSDLASWAARRDDVHVGVTVDAASNGWDGRIGVITTLFDSIRTDTEDAYAFICGPPVMYRHAIRKLLAMGFYENHIWLTLERRMKCGIGLCGNCQVNGLYLCQQGPLFSYREVRRLKEAV
jgi:sulfhydrogenase subunit gamma (sulfur reductase)